ncbi:MAG TPA: glutathione S-transferase family protein [Burkholderiaceae bacterium]|nr:glutathione S-transferase family protein [Burkholderiaceae bacterium]
MAEYRLFGRAGWGSVIVEAQLAALGLPFEFEEVPDLFDSEQGRRDLARFNPLSQVPTLQLPDGSVLTESAAITLYLADVTGRDDFVPAAAHRSRPQFLRWLVFLVANIYPTFTYADDPRRFVRDEGAAKAFDAAVGEYRRNLWRIVETAAGAPWFLGDRFSALDIYTATMTHWGPGRRWFEEQAPSLTAIARRAGEDARFGSVWKHNFPGDFAT